MLGTFAGLVLGIAISYVGAWEFLKLKLIYPGPFSIPLNVLLIGIGSGMGAPFIAALFTIVDGTRITVRGALGAYGITSVSASTNRWLPHLAERLVWMPQTVWLGLRGIFRKRGRAIMTISALALSGVTFLTVTLFLYSLNQRMIQVHENFTYDISVSPVGNNPSEKTFPRSLAQLRQILGGIPNVARVEREDEVIIGTPWGLLNLEGIDVDTQVYTRPMIAGRWFLPGEQNVLLVDEHTLQKAHLSIGETLPFTDGNGHSATWRIIGVVNDNPNQVTTGGVLLSSTDNIERFLGRPADSVSTVSIQAHDHSPAALQHLTNQVDQAMRAVGNAAPALTRQDELYENERTALNIGIILYTAAVGVALAGLLGLYNTLTSSVLERQREIGIWRSMGASNWQVSRAFWIEGLSLASLAWLVGAIVGLPIAYGFDLLVSPWLIPVPFAFDPWSLPLMLLALVMIATVASFGPTARASRARIAPILRYE